jgi:hypothetical protein
MEPSQALISAYLLGADERDLDHIYEVESKVLEPWKDSPGEVTGEDWRDYLGKKEYAIFNFSFPLLVKIELIQKKV